MAKLELHKLLLYAVSALFIFTLIVMLTDNDSKIAKKYVDVITQEKQREIDSLTRVTDALYTRIRMSDAQSTRVIEKLKAEKAILQDSLKKINVNIETYEKAIINYGGTFDERLRILANNLRSTN